MEIVHYNDPPFLIQHKLTDHLVSCQRSISFVKKPTFIIEKEKVTLEIFKDDDYAYQAFKTKKN